MHMSASPGRPIRGATCYHRATSPNSTEQRRRNREVEVHRTKATSKCDPVVECPVTDKSGVFDYFWFADDTVIINKRA
jgi:hypothetical protein